MEDLENIFVVKDRFYYSLITALRSDDFPLQNSIISNYSLVLVKY